MVCLQSLIESRDSFLWNLLQVLLNLYLNLQLLLTPSSAPLEPPEAYIDNEHDEKDTASCQFSIGGAGIQILGIAPVLLWLAGQIAGLVVELCGEERNRKRRLKKKNKGERRRMEKRRAADRNWQNKWEWINKFSWCDFRLTGERLASLQHLLYISYHDPLHILQLCVDAAQIPSRSAVDVRLLCFLDVCVWAGSNTI